MSATRRERRKSFRIPVTGKALLQHSGRNAGPVEGLFAIENVSIGGCSLRADGHVEASHGTSSASTSPMPTWCHLGDLVDVSLHLDEQGKIALPARVVRSAEPDMPSVGLSFMMTPPKLEDRLQDLVMRSIEREQRGDILVVDAHPERLARLFDTIRSVGQRIVAARTARDAMHTLEHAAHHIRLAIIAPIVGTSQARDIVKAILRSFPHVQCVLLGRGSTERLVHAIRSEVSRAPSPWNLSRLRKVIAANEVVVKTSVS
jgi:hypothetical protein